jgi:hypothetical protein
MGKFGKFLSAIGSDWLARMSGPLTVPFTLAALWFSSTAARISFAVLAVVAALLTCYRIWVKEYDRAEAEEAKNINSRIEGEIRRGYLEHRKAELTYVLGGAKYVWVTVPRQFCYVYFLIDAVNCNDASATLRPDLSSVELTVNGNTFHGKCSPIPTGLGVNDDFRKVKLISDAFNVSPLRRAVPWMGELGFVIESFDGSLTEGKDTLLASVRIKVVDSIKKTHALENKNLEMLIGKLGIMGEEIKY